MVKTVEEIYQAVSYTHLDVYKRQVQAFAAWPAGERPVQEGALAVSYTHLSGWTSDLPWRWSRGAT